MRINKQNRRAARAAKSTILTEAAPATSPATSTPVAPTEANGAEAGGAEAAGAEAGIKELVVHLLGRIVLIEHNGEYSALFLNVKKNEALGFPKHTPLFRASVDDVADEKGVEHAEATFADANGVVHAFWKMDGHQVRFDGLHGNKPTPDVKLDGIADLQTIYAKTVNPKATWIDKARLLEEDPREFGIAARLSLKDFDEIDSMFFEQNGALKESHVPAKLKQDREFLPSRALAAGKKLASVHKQVTHAIIRCKARIRTLTAAPVARPTIVMTPFGGGVSRKVEFDDTEPLQISFSNLCHCVGHDASIEVTIGGVPRILEDQEFAAYYELLEKPPALDARPLPFCRKQGAGGGSVPQCIPPGRR